MSDNVEPTVKVIYLAKRNPRIARDDFGARWKQHSLLGGSLTGLRPNFRQVAQCLNVHDRSAVPAASLEYDGVNLLTMVTPESVSAIWQLDEVHDHILSDELETFDRYVRHFALEARGYETSPGPMQGFCLIHFLKRDRRLDMDGFIDGLRAATAGLAAAVGLGRTVVNRVVDRQPGYNFDAVSEVWLADEEAAKNLLASEAWTQGYLGERGRIADHSRTLTMWTRINYARPPIQ